MRVSPRDEPRLSEAEVEALRLRYEEEPGRVAVVPVYPPPRDRAVSLPAVTVSRFPRYETTNGYVTLGDTDRVVLHFSGEPDSVEVFVLDFDATISYADELDSPGDEVRVTASNFYEPGIPCHKVIARNAVAGSNARVQVVGKWASLS